MISGSEIEYTRQEFEAYLGLWIWRAVGMNTKSVWKGCGYVTCVDIILHIIVY